MTRKTQGLKHFKQVIGGRRKFLAWLNEEWNMNHLPDPDGNEVGCRGDSYIFDWMKHHMRIFSSALQVVKMFPLS